ncbi:MAG: PAS domain-containing protein [Spirochaetaceae bacterium]|jgi:signal transduction histidine kinase|nr:PAS domain-containing protein [Spirochaetaceae bacterium]
MQHLIRKGLQKFEKLSPETARKLVESALFDITLLKNVLDSIAQGILVCDSKHNLILSNIYARHLISIDDDETGKKTVWHAVKSAEIKQFLRETLEACVDVEEREIELSGGANSAERLLSFDVHPLVSEGRITGSVILIADITLRRRKEANIKRIESLASLTTLAAGVAHEIKNPLAAISIHVQILKKTADKIRECCENADKECVPSLETHLEVVSDEIKRLNKIVVDFLFAVRPMDLNLRQTNINELIQEVLRLEQTETEAEGIECDAALDENIPPLVIDKQRIQEALVNLVKNAIEAMKETGAGEKRSGTRQGSAIRLVSKLAAGRALLSITDNGPGIAPEDISRIFEPYWTTKAGGSGLGLTLVFKVIQAHNGEITVHSEPGEGTCFLISLPLPQKDMRMITADGG